MNTFNHTTKWLSALTAIASTCSFGVALAGPADDATPSITVRYSDLDLSSPAGAQVLYQRIKGAARTVCAPLDSKQLKFQALWRACFEESVANAVSKVDRPMLTAVHQAAVRTTTG